MRAEGPSHNPLDWHERIQTTLLEPGMQSGLRYHHIGIPTTEPRPGERYLPQFDVYIEGFETSPFGVEWMRFGPNCSIPSLVQRVPHVAFQVDDLAAAIAGHRVLIEPNSPSAGVTVAFVEHNGAPVEFLQITSTPTPAGRAEPR